jgi:hypothetical protein
MNRNHGHDLRENERGEEQGSEQRNHCALLKASD